MRDFTELSSGFKDCHVRDPSIRGAGNLLRKQQHGFIDSVGFDPVFSFIKRSRVEETRKEVKSDRRNRRNRLTD